MAGHWGGLAASFVETQRVLWDSRWIHEVLLGCGLQLLGRLVASERWLWDWYVIARRGGLSRR